MFLLLPALAMLGQAADRTFEMASVKAHEGPMPRVGVTTSGLRLDGVSNVRGLIMYAYHLRNMQVQLDGAPYTVVGDKFYDVVAKADGDRPPTTAEFRQMLQALLADCFHLKVHREMQDMAVYELVVGKSGPKFKESASDASPTSQVHVMGRNYQVTMPRANMGSLVDMLEGSGFVGRPVLDKTGVTGTYDIKLIYTPDVRANRENPDPGDISILQAVEEQLGLKLESRKAMMEVLVVDSVEKPSGN